MRRSPGFVDRLLVSGTRVIKGVVAVSGHHLGVEPLVPSFLLSLKDRFLPNKSYLSPVYFILKCQGVLDITEFDQARYHSSVSVNCVLAINDTLISVLT